MQNNQDNKLLLAKIFDKVRISNKQNKIVNTYFFNEFQIMFLHNQLSKQKYANYFFYGGYEQALRKILIVYPDKINKSIAMENLNMIISVIRVKLPNEIKGKFKHKDYLGVLMSFGLTRERIGDIIVYDDRSYIVTLKENVEYIKDCFQQEKKFKKAKIDIINFDEIEPKPLEYANINISVNSLRLDNLVSEILKTSRRIAQNEILEENVYINNVIETKNTKVVKENDILVIRGKGKYIIYKFLGKNKKRERNY